jgi:hypothetical protein
VCLMGIGLKCHPGLNQVGVWRSPCSERGGGTKMSGNSRPWVEWKEEVYKYMGGLKREDLQVHGQSGKRTTGQGHRSSGKKRHTSSWAD